MTSTPTKYMDVWSPDFMEAVALRRVIMDELERRWVAGTLHQNRCTELYLSDRTYELLQIASAKSEWKHDGIDILFLSDFGTIVVRCNDWVLV